jgi:hypothetical protein
MASNEIEKNIIERSKIFATISTTFITILIALFSIANNADFTKFSQVKGKIFAAGIMGLITLFMSIIPLCWSFEYKNNETVFNILILISAISLAGATLYIILALHGLIFT